jgi:hypothetical protein
VADVLQAILLIPDLFWLWLRNFIHNNGKLFLFQFPARACQSMGHNTKAAAFTKQSIECPKLEQSIGEMFGAVLLGLDCRLCPCTEMDGDGASLPIVCLAARGIRSTRIANQDWTRPNNQRIFVTYTGHGVNGGGHGHGSW